MLKAVPTANYSVGGRPAKIIIEDDDTPPPGNGSGLKGEYFQDHEFKTLKGQRIDSNINFEWDKKAPIDGVDPKSTKKGGYSIRWTGKIQPLFSGKYRFETAIGSYSGARVWIDGNLIIDAWNTENLPCGYFEMQQKHKYDIKIEFDQRNFYGSMIKLFWSSDQQFKQVIPKNQLYPEE